MEVLITHRDDAPRHTLSERAGAFDEIDMDDEQCCRRNDGERRRKAKDLSAPSGQDAHLCNASLQRCKIGSTYSIKQAGPRKGKGRVVPSFSRRPLSVS